MPIDYTRYPPNWRTEIVPRIVERAEDQCEVCGIENGVTAYSIPVWIRDGAGYKRKRIWTTDETCVTRLAAQGAVSIEDMNAVTVVLTVAHLDHDEENQQVADDRLQAMCQSCHLNYDAQEKRRRAQEGNQ